MKIDVSSWLKPEYWALILFALIIFIFVNRKIPNTLFQFLILGLSISPFILLFPVYRVDITLGIRGKWALIFTYAASSVSFNTLLFVNYMKQLPSEIDEAAVLDGCNIWQLITLVILPMSKPIVVYTVLTSFIGPWTDFILAKIIMADKLDNYTVAIGLWKMLDINFKATYYQQFLAGSVVVAVPITLVFLKMQKYYVEGVTAGGVKG